MNVKILKLMQYQLRSFDLGMFELVFKYLTFAPHAVLANLRTVLDILEVKDYLHPFRFLHLHSISSHSCLETIEMFKNCIYLFVYYYYFISQHKHTQLQVKDN